MWSLPHSLPPLPPQSLWCRMMCSWWLGVWLAAESQSPHSLSSPKREVSAHTLLCTLLCAHLCNVLCTAPARPPHDVKVDRLNGTAMNVSFTRLTIVEARSINVTYTVRYSPQSSRKRQEREATVPDGQSHVVIRGLVPAAYTVVVVASNKIGKYSSEEHVLPGSLLHTRG